MEDAELGTPGFITGTVLLAPDVCCFALNCVVCLTGRVFDCGAFFVEDWNFVEDGDFEAGEVWGFEAMLVMATLAAPENIA